MRGGRGEAEEKREERRAAGVDVKLGGMDPSQVGCATILQPCMVNNVASCLFSILQTIRSDASFNPQFVSQPLRIIVDRMNTAEQCCECDWQGVSLEKHYGKSPECLPPQEIPKVPFVDLEKNSGQTLREKLRCATFEANLEAHVKRMSLELLMKTNHIQHGVALAEAAVTLLLDSVLDLLRPDAPAAVLPVRRLFASAQQSIKTLSDVDGVCARSLSRKACHVIERPLAPKQEAKKRYAFISLIALLSETLQNDPVARSHILTTSADWSTGRYYKQQPILYDDWTAGSRFRGSWLAKKAEARGEAPLRVRAALDGWNDDFTVWQSPPHHHSLKAHYLLYS